jgi:hypothetical protein
MRAAALALALTAAVAGCGLGSAPTAARRTGTETGASAPTGGATSPAAATAAKVRQAETTHEYPSPAPAPEAVSGGAASPVRAVRAFAVEYINWTADTVAAQMTALAAASVGQARSAMQLAAAQTARDYELQQSAIANTGTVEAIAPLTGARNRYVVVTRERTTASETDAYRGLRPAWHVAIADVTQVAPGRWALSRWQPET